ncbi:hypothetical protein QM312_34435 [Burkholderia cenocepacia]|jgi:hypothetical protein|uniref:hypothetical protein n=1 Tax=Burkholderia cenocepacia TaxID=95486 RepID=UPI0024B82579|nr:hypothetical protein [Burkholderia cenocepacia]MDI9647090.1 hypothetical protein [Burkholderia cenocepacia]MDI9701046.1 hypothetical protein [Burkholderia cenocepacia]
MAFVQAPTGKGLRAGEPPMFVEHLFRGAIFMVFLLSSSGAMNTDFGLPVESDRDTGVV